jgi:hypothetical protein
MKKGVLGSLSRETIGDALTYQIHQWMKESEESWAKFVDELI